ncbi:MAG: hypothetical protein JO019_00105 [Candidatus Kaiserbacteria bacterium]|nr:hypothetical protein [Candidatus Kaiserbacteria bacterium]
MLQQFQAHAMHARYGVLGHQRGGDDTVDVAGLFVQGPHGDKFLIFVEKKKTEPDAHWQAVSYDLIGQGHYVLRPEFALEGELGSIKRCESPDLQRYHLVNMLLSVEGDAIQWPPPQQGPEY